MCKLILVSDDRIITICIGGVELKLDAFLTLTLHECQWLALGEDVLVPYDARLNGTFQQMNHL